MPSYKVLEKGFYGGRIYDPQGKRKVLHTDKPFPSEKGKEQVPSWLEAIEAKKQPQQKSTTDGGPTVAELKKELTALGVEFKGNASKAVLMDALESHKKVQQDRKDIDSASFLGEGESGSAVQTL